MARVAPIFSRREGNRHALARAGFDVSVPWIRFERSPKQVDIEHESRRGFRIVDQPDPLLRFAILTRAHHD